MWNLMTRVINAAELRATVVWFSLSAVLQGVTLALMIPFLQALFSRSESTTSWLIAITISGVAAAVVDMYAMIRSYRISVYEVCDTMIDRVADHVLRLPLGWFTAKREAAVANALSRHVSVLSHLASLVIPNILNAIIVPSVMVIATAFIDWRLALIMALAAIPLALIWRSMSGSITRANERSDATAEQAAGRMIEFARLQPVLRATGVGADWQPLQDALRKDSDATLAGLRASGRPAQGFNWVVILTFAIAVAVGWALVSGGQLDPVAFLVVVAVVARTLLPLTQVAMFQTEANRTEVAMRAIIEILDAEPLPEPAPEQAQEPESSEIEFSGVSFAYDDGAPVLNDISFVAPQGSVTALVGPSGSGKSTVLRLAARFWDVDSGKVTIGGKDVRDIGSVNIMERVAMVFQDVYLFNGSIRENLRIAKPDATDAELEVAAKRARLNLVIDALPDGWDTQVGPAGKSLSGGERQRVAIARAFLKDAPILLLDEITSSLDGENESAIAQVVSELAEGRTVIVVAHRLSTIKEAAQVIFLEPTPEGARIAQRGTPEQLANEPGEFADFTQALTESRRWQLTGN
ncbi:ABC transporter ATP-binding protein [Trueperella bialowiezensis]|uniref:Iron import ATP-binding/permease protein IrtB n=1 Tax=Trueperella bialowiezensis TaxID=312285 RepID=A0A3S4UZZ1_9ACTO|nr:ABC transporter ATP-binding protein [Trueperella bialowiezensis]VEI13976.1 Iron import ATP-binding/permease protein IrtB [Trueperella bialowiezensis]